MIHTELLTRIQAEGTPLIDGSQVTYVWQGKLPARLIGDFCAWEQHPQELQPAGENLWVHRMELPLDAYMEYAFLAEDGEARLPDPYNPRLTPNGVGKYNHYFYMPQGHPTPLARRGRRVPQGLVTRHTLDTMFPERSQREVYLYQPPVTEPCPLLVVWDGPDYLRRGKLAIIVDNLIAQKRIRPLALALVQNGGKSRYIEYMCSEASIAFLMGWLLPYAAQHLNLLDLDQHPGAYGVMGASMGGVMALYTGARLPWTFGHVLAQSGAYTFPQGQETVLFNLLRHADPQALKVWMDVGLYDIDWLIPASQRIHELLRSRGYAVEYRSYPAGHNYPAWRDDLSRGLEYLFPSI